MRANADTAVAHLDAQLRADAPRGDAHPAARRRVVDRVAYQVAQHSSEQNRMTKGRTMCRSDNERDAFRPCHFCKLCREILENGTQPDRNIQIFARVFTQLQSLDELAQHVSQSASGTLDSRQLFPLLLAVYDSRHDIVRAGDDLQRLAQIVTGHRQQRRQEVGVSLIRIAVRGTANSPCVPAGRWRRSHGIKKSDRIHSSVLRCAMSRWPEGVRSLPGPRPCKLGGADW